jgi:hypothetical protein
MKWVFTICVSLIINICFGQYIEKKWFDKSDSVYGFYLSIPPSSGRVQGALVLLDGYGANAEGFLSETKIHNVAWANDILTIGIPTGTRLYLDKTMIELLNKILKDVLQTYGLKKDQMAIGGMSSGGTIALRYTELCNQKPAEFPVQPQAVFAIDSPVDLVDLYKSSERDLQKNNKGWWLGECQMIIDRLKNELGNPYKDLTKYREVSPLLREAKDTVNEKTLSAIAVRTYHDADVNWYIQNRQRSLYETNMLNGSELISRLVALGNQRAEFIASKIPGRRSDGQRHPHSWNIVDETDLIQWVKASLNFYPDHLAVPYSYTAPEGWASEVILFPIDFAAGLTYNGFEELRFAPGWGNASSNEKWAYTILWWLDGGYNFDEKILQQNIETYFSGLTKRRAIADKLDMTKYQPAKAKVQKIKTEKSDYETFSASASIFDAQVTQKPGTLFFKVHIKECPDKSRTIVLFEVAGNPFTETVWQQLDTINTNFKCINEKLHQ